MNVAVDTSALYALMDRRDKWHTSAVGCYEALQARDDLLTTDHILEEGWYLLRSHAGRSAAMQFWDWLTEGPISIVGISFEMLEHARQIAHYYEGFSFVDCTTMAAMETLGVNQVFSFDHHFDVYRYGVDARKSFTRLPRDLA